MATRNRRWLPIALTVFVVLAGTVVGGFFGILASNLYDNPVFHKPSEEPTTSNMPLLGKIGRAHV